MDAIFVFARFHARAGCEEAVMDAMRAVAPPSRAEAGCLAIGFYRSVRDPLEFFLHSRWADEAAFDLHASLPHTQRFMATMPPLIDHPFRIGLTRPLDGTGGPSE